MTDLHVERTSPDGPRRGTIIAVPGLAESAATLAEAAAGWAGRGFRVVAIDPRGHGRSPRWTSDLLARHPGDVIVEELAAAVDEVLEGDPTIVFGHSAGGAAAAAVAVSRPRGVVGLLLEDPFWRLPVTPHQDRAVAERAADDLVRLQAMTDAGRRAEIGALHPRWSADAIAGSAEAKARTDVALVRNGDVIPTRGWPTLLTELAQAGVRVHIVTGTVMIGMTAGHRAIARSLGADVTVIEGAGHFVRRDAPAAFDAVAGSFLDAIVPR